MPTSTSTGAETTEMVTTGARQTSGPVDHSPGATVTTKPGEHYARSFSRSITRPSPVDEVLRVREFMNLAESSVYGLDVLGTGIWTVEIPPHRVHHELGITNAQELQAAFKN
jgi:hypothetical protein